MWETAELARLFATPIWTGCHSAQRRHMPGGLVIRDHHFWLPLLALFHGARQEEVAQLCANDVRTEPDLVPGRETAYLNIHEEGDSQLKNEQSTRRVPIHRLILELGFLDHVAGVRAAGGGHLWPGLRRVGPDLKYGYAYSKDFGRYCRRTRVYREGRGFHSLRHTFRTFLEETDTKSAWISRLMGHKLTALLGEGATYTKTKNRRVLLCVLKEAVDAFDPGVDLSHLLPRRAASPGDAAAGDAG